MEKSGKNDAWTAGDSYETYMGRWSTLIAKKFISWLNVEAGIDWIEVGCGTGALTRIILSDANPGSVLGIEPSDGFLDHARKVTNDPRARFVSGDAEALPADDSAFDIATSALVLNFVPDKQKAIKEMRRVTRSGGTVSFYVWDYPGGGVGFMDLFWKCAAELDPSAIELDEAVRFPFCTSEGLREICEAGELQNVEINKLEIETVFPTFDDLIYPFSLGAGPAPGYFGKLDNENKQALTALIAERVGPQEPVQLTATAWAVKALNG